MLGDRGDVLFVEHLQISAHHPRQPCPGLEPAAPAAVRGVARVVVFIEMAKPPVRIGGDGEMLRGDPASTAPQRQRADDGADRASEARRCRPSSPLNEPVRIGLPTGHDTTRRNRNQIRRGAAGVDEHRLRIIPRHQRGARHPVCRGDDIRRLPRVLGRPEPSVNAVHPGRQRPETRPQTHRAQSPTPSRLVAKQSASSAVIVTAIAPASPRRPATSRSTSGNRCGSRHSANGRSTPNRRRLGPSRSADILAAFTLEPPTSHPRIGGVIGHAWATSPRRGEAHGLPCEQRTREMALTRRDRQLRHVLSARPIARRDRPSSASG